MTRRSKLVVVIAAIVIVGGVAAHTVLSPPRDTAPSAVNQSAREGEFDHGHRILDEILKRHVESGLVDYRSLASDRPALEDYLNELAAVTEAEFDSWARDQQLAMLINLYNAATLRLVLDHYPVGSIKDIGGLFKRPWSIDSLSLFGKATTLGHVEHDLLRENYNEPRIHFAIVCAALGCPELRRGAFTAPLIDTQLNEQGEKFFRDKSKNRVDLAASTLHVSKVFKWFKDDFEPLGGVIGIARSYLPEEEASSLRDDFKIRYTNYDWSLNE
ncbi:MAG: DUF547 domain-containing protein [Verrucomicrobiales bacterium]